MPPRKSSLMKEVDMQSKTHHSRHFSNFAMKVLDMIKKVAFEWFLLRFVYGIDEAIRRS